MSKHNKCTNCMYRRSICCLWFFNLYYLISWNLLTSICSCSYYLSKWILFNIIWSNYVYKMSSRISMKQCSCSSSCMWQWILFIWNANSMNSMSCWPCLPYNVFSTFTLSSWLVCKLCRFNFMYYVPSWICLSIYIFCSFSLQFWLLFYGWMDSMFSMSYWICLF